MKKKLDPKSQEALQELKDHLESGWSLTLFRSKIRNRDKGLRVLAKTFPEARKLIYNKRQKEVSKRTGYVFKTNKLSEKKV